MEDKKRADDQAQDVDKLVGDLEAHSLRDEVPGGDEVVDTDTCGTCTCPCDD